MSQGNDGFQKGGFRSYQPDKSCSQGLFPEQRQGKVPKKEKARKKLILNQDLQSLKHLKKKDIAMPGNLMAGLPVSGLMILGLKLQDGKARESTLLGWRYPL